MSDSPPTGSSGAKTPDRDLIARARKALRRDSPLSSGVAHVPLSIAPNRFPGYQVIREIHRGGQGVVYQALQLTTKRKVAIKVLHGGPEASAADRKRFEREVDILAQLHHPNIVAVLDSGQVDGSFFYVMDYISGQPLDQFVQKSNPTIPQVIELCAKICDAVNAAHLRGVIHRDIKPGNIRVDASGEPHIVDFGLAKTASGSTTGGEQPRMMTMTGQFIGSLPWASPEQAEGAPEKIDIRTDVYSLGVVMFQVLTGAFPYDVIGNMRDVLDNILRAPPRRPSTIRRQINDEVETIVLKCLSKDRDRRYQTAGDVARDLRRYLVGEPIEAKRDSGWYVLRKMVRRHTAPFVSGALALVAIIVFAVMMWSMWRDASAARRDAESAENEAVAARENAERDRDRAVRAEDDARTQFTRAEQQRDRAIEAETLAQNRLTAAEAARTEAESARERADTEAAKAQRIQRFVQSIFAKADPDAAPGHDITVREALDAAVLRADTELTEDPEVEAAIRLTIGQSYFALGLRTQAEQQFRAAVRLFSRELGEDDPQTYAASHELALTLRNLGKYTEAADLYRRFIAARTSAHGPTDTNRLIAVVNLARVLEAQGDLDGAADSLKDAADRFAEVRGEEHDATCQTRIMLANVLLKQGKMEQAEPLITTSLAQLEANHAPPHSIPAKARLALAEYLDRTNKPEEAEAAYRRTLDELAKVYDPLHPDRIASASRFGRFLDRRGRPADAEPILRDVASAAAASPSVTKGDAALYRARLGVCLLHLNRIDPAINELAPALDALRADRGMTDADSLETARALIEAYTKADRPGDAARVEAMLPPARPGG
ncbi:MAG: serine/threonine protein kinase [Phycisphaeraceae bacterium]|nr:serine/threonine protein kinase [Phycisphaeraceae bacterium]